MHVHACLRFIWTGLGMAIYNQIARIKGVARVAVVLLHLAHGSGNATLRPCNKPGDEATSSLHDSVKRIAMD